MSPIEPLRVRSSSTTCVWALGLSIPCMETRVVVRGMPTFSISQPARSRRLSKGLCCGQKPIAQSAQPEHSVRRNPPPKLGKTGNCEIARRWDVGGKV